MGAGGACCCMLLRYDIAGVLTGYLGVDEVTRLLCTSKDAQQQIVHHFRSRSDAARRLVVAAAEEAAARMANNKAWKSRCSVSADQALHQFKMLVEQELLPEDDSVIDDLLNVAHIPAAVAADVIEAGRLFSYQQLLSAVKATVPGVEVWMKVCRYYKVQAPKGMHPAAEALCCDEELCLQELQSAGITREILVDLLHFAVAMPRGDTVNNSLVALCHLPAGEDVLADEAFQIVQAAVQAALPVRVCTLTSSLPAAKQLSGEKMQTLVQAAMEGSSHVMIGALCISPPASRISAEFAKRALMRCATQPHADGLQALSALCLIPAAEQLTASDVMQLFRPAVGVKYDNEGAELNLVRLFARQMPAARHLAAAEVAELLDPAVKAGHKGHVNSLCRSRGAYDINRVVIRRILITASKSEDPDVRECFSELLEWDMAYF